MFFVAVSIGLFTSIISLSQDRYAEIVKRVGNERTIYDAIMVQNALYANDFVRTLILWYIGFRLRVSLVGWLIYFSWSFMLIEIVSLAIYSITFYISELDPSDYTRRHLLDAVDHVIASYIFLSGIFAAEVVAYTTGALKDRVILVGIFCITLVPMISLTAFLLLDAFKAILWLLFCIISWPVLLALSSSVVSGEKFSLSAITQLLKRTSKI